MARLSVDDSRLTLSVLRDIQLPPLYHRRRGLVKGFLGPAVRLPARFMDVIASHVLANALTPHVSACHCEPVPCPADTPQVSAYPTRQTVLQPQMRICLQHVIANQCAHLRQSASCGDTLQIGCCFGEFVTPYGFAQSITFRFVQPPRRLSKTPRKKPGPQMGSRPALWISWRPGSSTDR